MSWNLQKAWFEDLWELESFWIFLPPNYQIEPYFDKFTILFLTNPNLTNHIIQGTNVMHWYQINYVVACIIGGHMFVCQTRLKLYTL